MNYEVTPLTDVMNTLLGENGLLQNFADESGFFPGNLLVAGADGHNQHHGVTLDLTGRTDARGIKNRHTSLCVKTFWKRVTK